MKQFFKVKLRRSDSFKVKPEAELIDGNTYSFLEGWITEEGIYEGEQVWIPMDDTYPSPAAPAWLAEGDLIASDITVGPISVTLTTS